MIARAGTLLFAAALLLACGGTSTTPAGGGSSRGAAIDGPAPPPFVVARVDGALAALAADATHVYWADESGVWRRPHGPAGKPERIWKDAFRIVALAPAAGSLFTLDAEHALRGISPDDTAASIAQLDAPAWGLAADGNRAVVGVEEHLEVHAVGAAARSIDLGGVGSALAAHDGVAYAVVTGDGVALVAIELASGKRQVLRSGDALASLEQIAVWGDRVVVSNGDGVEAYGRDDSTVRLSPFGRGSLAADDRGWVSVIPREILVAQGADGVLRAGSAGLAARVAAYPIAVGDVWTYATAYDDDGLALVALPRAGGSLVWTLPVDSTVSACAEAGTTLVCSITTEDDKHVLVEVDGATIVHRFTALDAPCEQIAVEGDEVACMTADGLVFTSARNRSGALAVADVILGARIALHKGRLYLTEGDQVSLLRPDAADKPVVIANGPVTRRRPEATGLGTELVFADDHMYFVSSDGPADGIYQVDEQGRVESFWAYASNRNLHADLVRVGDALYVHDLAAVMRVPLDGSAAREVHREDEDRIIGVYRAGDRVVVEIEGGPTGRTLRALAGDRRAGPATAAATTIVWDAPYDFVAGSERGLIVGADEVLTLIPPPR